MSERKSKWMQNSQARNVVVLVAIVAIVALLQTVFGGNRGVYTIRFDEDNTGMTLSDPQGEVSVVLKYQDIQSISETDSLDVGEYVSGTDTKKCQFGSWRNDEYGEYTLCALPKVKNHIVMQTTHGVVALNFESKDSTHHLYEALQKLLAEYGGSGDS